MTFQHVQAIVFDWAGTMIDHGCRAPAIVFQEIFKRQGIEITAAQAREPMGMAKREHIAAICSMANVAKQWSDLQGRVLSDSDIDSMYEQFLPLQRETLAEHSTLIEGASEICQWCRNQGLKIGSSTGYTRDLMRIVSKAAASQGYEPDCVLCSEDAPRGRPAPFLLFQASQQLDVYPMWRFAKVDDTPVGIEAGRNAGCWTIGITKTGNGVGLSQEETAALSPAELADQCQTAEDSLRSKGAHFIAESVADIRPILQDIEERLAQGEMP